MQTFFIPGILPGMNEVIAAAKQIHIRGGIRVGDNYSLLKRKATDRISAVIFEAKITPVEALTLDILWIEKNKRRDPDNIASGIKMILDALVETQIIKNDGWRYNKGWVNNFKVGTPHGVEVTICEVKLQEQIQKEISW